MRISQIFTQKLTTGYLNKTLSEEFNNSHYFHPSNVLETVQNKEATNPLEFEIIERLESSNDYHEILDVYIKNNDYTKILILANLVIATLKENQEHFLSEAFTLSTIQKLISNKQFYNAISLANYFLLRLFNTDTSICFFIQTVTRYLLNTNAYNAIIPYLTSVTEILLLNKKDGVAIKLAPTIIQELTDQKEFDKIIMCTISIMEMFINNKQPNTATIFAYTIIKNIINKNEGEEAIKLTYMTTACLINHDKYNLATTLAHDLTPLIPDNFVESFATLTIYIYFCEIQQQLKNKNDVGTTFLNLSKSFLRILLNNNLHEELLTTTDFILFLLLDKNMPNIFSKASLMVLKTILDQERCHDADEIYNLSLKLPEIVNKHSNNLELHKQISDFYSYFFKDLIENWQGIHASTCFFHAVTNKNLHSEIFGQLFFSSVSKTLKKANYFTKELFLSFVKVKAKKLTELERSFIQNINPDLFKYLRLN